MKVYYLQSEYQPGKHRIVTVLYNEQVFRFDTTTLSPYNVLTVEEIDPVNKPLCLDLIRTVNKVDADGDGKYHVNNSGLLLEKENWQERTWQTE